MRRSLALRPHGAGRTGLENVLPLAAAFRYHRASKVAYSLTAPASGKLAVSPKNCVREIFPLSNKKHPANRRQPAQPRRKTRPTPTKTVSGIPYWPARDPIGERGGLNLYGFVRNRPSSEVDVLGQATIIHQTNSTRLSDSQWHDTILVLFGHNWDLLNFAKGGTCDNYVGCVFTGCSANRLNDRFGIRLSSVTPWIYRNHERNPNVRISETVPDATPTDWLTNDNAEAALEANIRAAKNGAESLCDPSKLCQTYVKVDCLGSMGLNPFNSGAISYEPVFKNNCGKTLTYDCKSREWK